MNAWVDGENPPPKLGGVARSAGVVPSAENSRKHSEKFSLRNHLPSHRKKRDGSALLTQEGNFPLFLQFHFGKEYGHLVR